MINNVSENIINKIVEDIKTDRCFKSITELWISSDPYKHRLMRIYGVDEFYITGKATVNEHCPTHEISCIVSSLVLDIKTSKILEII